MWYAPKALELLITILAISESTRHGQQRVRWTQLHSVLGLENLGSYPSSLPRWRFIDHAWKARGAGVENLGNNL